MNSDLEDTTSIPQAPPSSPTKQSDQAQAPALQQFSGPKPIDLESAERSPRLNKEFTAFTANNRTSSIKSTTNAIIWPPRFTPHPPSLPLSADTRALLTSGLTCTILAGSDPRTVLRDVPEAALATLSPVAWEQIYGEGKGRNRIPGTVWFTEGCSWAGTLRFLKRT